MLNDFIHIRKKLDEVTISVNEIVGSFVPSEYEIEILKKLSENNCVENFVFVNNKNKLINEIKIGDKIQIRLYSNKLGDEKYYETFDDLVKFSSQTYPLQRFYIHSLGFDSSIKEIPNEIENFRETTKLVSFLRSISDYQKGNELVFFQVKQLVLTTDYSKNDIQKLTGVDALITHIRDSADTEERRIIFTNELIASVSKISEQKNRFGYLLKNFSELASNYHKSHSLYLEKYSYQKFKSELDKEIIDYSKKIQSVINDAQSKLVAIPVAFLLIVGQFDLTGAKIFFNLALILSSLVFSILLEVLLRNQFSALDFVSEDIKRFKGSFEEKKKEILGPDFSNSFEKINVLYNKQRTYLKIIRYLVWLTPVFAFVLFILSLMNNTIICILKKLFEVI